MRWWSVACVGLGACSFGGNAGDDGDDGDDAVIDAPPRPDGVDSPPGTPDAAFDGPPGVFNIAHLAGGVEAQLTSTFNLVIMTNRTIDTSTGSISPPFDPAVVVLPSVAQENGGPNVMVIQAGTIQMDGSLYLLGDKPLIIVASATMQVNAFEINADASMEATGPGGYPGTMGPGAGGSGTGCTANGDSGGAGGGFGTIGGAGGNCNGQVGGTAGPVNGSAGRLEGGSGGGNGSPQQCDGPGGAGGGAIQLSAAASISITGTVITAAGGGGRRGEDCTGDGGTGGGGGAGGMIYLQSPLIIGTATLGANGGGGGSSGSANGTTLGLHGSDGTPTSGGLAGTNTASASGGEGGAGASGLSPGTGGENRTSPDENGGAGGGGVGRIYYHTAGPAPGFTASPPASAP